MGKLNDSLLSGSSGRTGRLVVANVSGTEILRARPRKRTGQATPKQLLVQTRMTQAYNFLSAYKAFAKDYFGKRVGMRSRFNQAMTNVLDAYKLDFLTLTIVPTYSEIEFAQGSLLAANPTALTATVAGSFTIDWFNNAAGNTEREADDLQILYYAVNEKKPIFLENAGIRADGTIDIPVAPTLQGKMLHVWIAFRSTVLMEASTSAYVGTVVLL